jgi:hypothetical protein
MALSQEDRDLIDPQGAANRQAVAEAVEIHEELTDLNPNIEMDAKEFGEHVKNGGWRLGLLVARNVSEDYGTGEAPWEVEGISKATYYRRQAETSVHSVNKVSARAFAKQAGNIGHVNVSKYLKAWNMAAADGLTPLSSELTPGQVVSFNELDEDGKPIFTQKSWDTYFKPPAGENEKTVESEVIKPVEKVLGIALRDWVCTSQYDGKDDNLNKAYKDFQALIRKGYEGVSLCEEVATALGMEFKDEGN